MPVRRAQGDGRIVDSPKNTKKRTKKYDEISQIIDSGSIQDSGNLSYDSCLMRLNYVENEKELLQKKLSKLESDTISILEVKLEEIKTSMDFKIQSLSKELYYLFDKAQDESKSVTIKSTNIYKRKEFIPRPSIFSIMLSQRDENYRTIFNMVLCVLILWGLNLAFDDMREKQMPDWDLLTWGIVKDLKPFFIHWLIMFCTSFVIVPLAHFAAESRGFPIFQMVVLIYIILQGIAFYYSATVVSYRDTPFSMPLAVGLMAEQARMSMKMHSYFREKILWYRYNGEYACRPVCGGIIPFIVLSYPSFDYFVKEVEKYFYFMFVPTLIYRDEYPRTNRIRWEYVLLHLGEALCIIYYAFLIFRTSYPNFEGNISLKPINSYDFIHVTFSCMGHGMTLMIFTHYLVLHLVQNIFSELTRFADRKFYGEWWNSRTFTVFYREWNGVVHDFIHSYLYTDMIEYVKLPKIVSLLLCFFISAVVHEYIVCVAMGFFLPILAVLFGGPGVIFILLTKNKTGRIWNIFMWLMLSTGNAMLMVMYCREYYVRHHPSSLGSTLDFHDFMVPRTFRIQFPNYFS